MLKVKFNLPTEEIKRMIERHNSKGMGDTFLVEPCKYSEKQTIVVGQSNPIMYLIGECAAAGHDSLLDVSQL